MANTIAFDASPASLLRAMRGVITDAHLSNPDVLHIEVRDALGAIWRLATQDAEFVCADPCGLRGKSIQDAEIRPTTGDLRLALSDGATLAVSPARREANDDPPNWELITPDGRALEFGPGLRWQISPADGAVAKA